MNAGLNLSRNWTVESGTSGSRVQAEKVVFSKESTKQAETQGTGETFQFSTPQAEVSYSSQGLANGSAPSGLQALDSTDRGEARRIIKDLNKKARLFARNEDRELVRIAPGTAKELLDSGKPIEVVTRVGNEVQTESRSSRGRSVDAHFFIADDVFRSESSSSSRSEKVEYTSSPISEWDSLLWMDDDDARGVPGTPVLPGSGQSVEISHDWEKSWSKSSEVYNGFFRVDSDVTSSSGFNRISNRAEG
jgi:hypothetical protein